MNIMILQKMLEMLPAVKNIEITSAANGKEGLEEYQRISRAGKRVRLILMDCEMPIMDGYDASKNIREFESKFTGLDSPTTIVGLSGNSGDAFNRRCKTCGMTDSLTKPVAIEQLSKVLEKAFGGKINN
jgi:CheY-like chemotaxis protein